MYIHVFLCNKYNCVPKGISKMACLWRKLTILMHHFIHQSVLTLNSTVNKLFIISIIIFFTIIFIRAYLSLDQQLLIVIKIFEDLPNNIINIDTSDTCTYHDISSNEITWKDKKKKHNKKRHLD